jgi:uncharacterized membrane protein
MLKNSSYFIAFLLFIIAYQTQGIDYSELLSLTVGMLTTVVATTFAFVLVALQLASVQFSPRILRVFFAEDAYVKRVLYFFLGVISYCLILKLLGLKTEEWKILPILGIIAGIWLIAVQLPLFFSYVTDAINVATITRRITDLTLLEIEKKYAKLSATSNSFSNKKVIETEKKPWLEIPATEYGYVQEIDYKVVTKIATRYPNLFLKTNQLIGTFIHIGEPLFLYTPTDEKTSLSNEEITQLQRAFSLHKYRSYTDDIHFCIRQLVDIAIKAISPAVNDPTTAINCIDHLGVIIKNLADVAYPSKAAQTLPSNVQIRELDFAMTVDHAFDQIYQWGKGDYLVVRHLVTTIAQIIHCTHYAPHRAILIRQAEEMHIDLSQFSVEQRHLVEKALLMLEKEK